MKTKILNVIYSIDYWNYDISLGENALDNIRLGKIVKTTIYHDSYLFKGKEDIKERMKKELVLGLLSDDESSEEHRDVVIRPYGNKSDRVIIDISQDLLDNLIKFGWNRNGYCYNIRGNKVSFYIEDGPEKEDLIDKIKSLKFLYSKVKRKSNK